MKAWLALALLVTFSPAWADDEVSGSLALEGRVSQVWTKSHPAKLFECWGKPMEAQQWQDNIKQLGYGASGEATLQQKNRDNGGFGIYQPVTAKWNANLNKDRVFTVEFSQAVEAKKVDWENKTCNTTMYLSRLDALSTIFASHASMMIPANVWMIKVRKLEERLNTQTKGEINAFVQAALPMTEDSIRNASLDPNSSVKAGDFTYMFVHPGERIDFTIQWNSQEISSLDFRVQFEVRFVGYDDCANVVGDQRVWASGQGLEKMKSILSLEHNPDLHRQIVALSCIRNPEYVGSMLYNNHGHDLVDLLDWLSQDVRRWEEQVEPNRFVPVLRASALMTLFDLSKTVLIDIKQFCTPKDINNIFGYPEEFNAVVRGYHYAGREYAEIKYLLDYSPVDVIEKLTSTLETLQAANTTYARVAAVPDILDVLREMQFLIYDHPFQVFTNIKDIVDAMPKTRVGEANRQGVTEIIGAAEVASSQLNKEIKTQLLSFKSNNLQLIRSENLRSALEDYKASMQAVREKLNTDIKWFEFNSYENGYVSTSHSQFTKDMQILNHDLVKTVGEELGYLHASKLDDGKTKFLNLDETVKLYSEVVNCLGTSHDPQ